MARPADQGGSEAQGVAPLLITGMPRSGTSATARLLGAAGLDLGDDLMPPSEANRLGFYEDVQFYELNRALLAAGLGAAPELQPRWAYADRIDPSRLGGLRGRAQALMAERMARGRPWGFKDPRTTMLLDFYDSLEPRARYLFVYRAPWDVLDSLLRLEGGPLRGQAGLIVSAWVAYNSRLLAFLEEHPERAALIHVNATGSQPEEILAIGRRLLSEAGAPLLDGREAPEVFESALLTSLSDGHALAELLGAERPEAVALYDRLEGRAELPSSAGVARPAAGPARLRGTGAVGADVVFIGPAQAAPAPGEYGQVVQVDPGHSASAAANSGVAATTADVVVVLFDAAATEAILAGVAAIAEEPGMAAVLLGPPQSPVNGAQSDPTRVAPEDLVERADAFAGVVLRRSAWLEHGGFDPRLPVPAFAPWAFAAGCAASGAGVAILEAAAPGGQPSRPEAERRLAMRSVLERNGALAARTLDRAFGDITSRRRTVELLEERTAERDHALDVLATTTEERDQARRMADAAERRATELVRRSREIESTRAWRLVTRWWRLRGAWRRRVGGAARGFD
jgi:hypothetical protein